MLVISPLRTLYRSVQIRSIVDNSNSFFKLFNNSINVHTRKMGNSSSNTKYKVVFATGPVHFESAYKYTRQCLEKYSSDIEVSYCEMSNLMNEIHDIHVLIPFMTLVSKNVIAHAPNLKMIIQFGVGLEGT